MLRVIAHIVLETFSAATASGRDVLAQLLKLRQAVPLQLTASARLRSGRRRKSECGAWGRLMRQHAGGGEGGSLGRERGGSAAEELGAAGIPFCVWRLWRTTVHMMPRMKMVKILATRAAGERGRRAKDLLPFPSPCGSLLARSY